ncbi:hypothetical protein, partial [Stella sp.]|uniref:hypothetical protein n=1 Tax=Stella sp. TaxID=2912054 RepID=UPI0035B1F584
MIERSTSSAIASEADGASAGGGGGGAAAVLTGAILAAGFLAPLIDELLLLPTTGLVRMQTSAAVWRNDDLGQRRG